MEKLKRQLAEAEAALESRKKPPEETGPRIVGEGLVIDEWVNLLTSKFFWANQFPLMFPLLFLALIKLCSLVCFCVCFLF